MAKALFVLAIVLAGNAFIALRVDAAGALVLNSDALTDDTSEGAVQLETDDAGNWVAVWQSYSEDSGLDIYFAVSNDDGVTWSPPELLEQAQGADASTTNGDPQVATDNYGNWVVIWTRVDFAGDPGQIVASRSFDIGNSWTSPIVLSSLPAQSAGADNLPELASYPGGDFIVIWASDDTASGDSDIYLTRSSDGGVNWSTPAAVNASASSDTSFEGEPSIANNGAGMWVAGWSSSPFGGPIPTFYVARSFDAGATWSTPATLDLGAYEDPWSFGLQLAGNGTGWLATLTSKHGASDEDLLVFTSSEGLAWSSAALLNANAGSDSSHDSFPAIVRGSGTTWLAFWAPYPGNGVLSAKSLDNGATRSYPHVLHLGTNNHSSVEAARSMQGRLLVVWASFEVGPPRDYHDTDLEYLICSLDGSCSTSTPPVGGSVLIVTDPTTGAGRSSYSVLGVGLLVALAMILGTVRSLRPIDEYRS